MNDLEVWIIIILVVGIIASNLAVLKYSAKFKMPQFGDPKPKSDSDKKPSQANESSSTKDSSNESSDKTS
ncbi:DUF2897 family protein [Shewanella donghaensis]|uniref:DUF2897 family protein n=1 Tax=Shewanella donghaensis TaxID=238836 RepID=UPI001182F9F2|nr:DUF2897 family protein [Shewanella donghaensis]